MKTCLKCKQNKPESLFYRRAASRDGLQQDCKSCSHARAGVWRKQNRSSVAAQEKLYKLANAEKIRRQQKKYRQEHREVVRASNRCWVEKNRDHALAYGRNYNRTRRKKPEGVARVRATLRHRIHMALRAQHSHKTSRTTELIGCSIEHLRLWLTFYFQPGMLWSNYGEWHIDHTRPCASFDLTDLAQQKECFHYTNLQPLWAQDNLKKGKRYDRSVY